MRRSSKPLPNSNPCSARTLRASSGRWTVCRSPSACWTRRCTSFSPTPRTLRRRSPSERGVESLEERNPMLGLRGCRLGLLKPEVYLMQARAIAKAARTVREGGGDPVVEIMIPLVGFPSELERMRTLILAELAEESLPIGTMIELPRACAVAGEIADHADFFSFGTNDLTQMVCGISRDDAEEKFLAEYLRSGLLSFNPFQTIDRDGVGQFVKTAIERGREANPRLKLGICGEHGGDPKSIAFFHETSLNYVSCSPFRVPGARLAAAQAVLKE